MEFTRDCSDLFNAVVNGSTDDVLKVIQRGTGVNVLNGLNQSPLIVFIIWSRGKSEKNLDIVSLLIEKGTELNVVDMKGKTALMYAIEQCKTSEAKFLIRNGCDVDIENTKKQTALHLAIQHDLTELVLPLIESSSDIDIQDDSGQTPLFTSVNKMDLETVKLLVKFGADVNLLDKSGISPLLKAIQLKLNSIASFLITSGANIDCCRDEDLPPLAYSIQENMTTVSEELINKGCNIHFKNTLNQTALHLAVKFKCINTTRLLLEKGKRWTDGIFLLIERGVDLDIADYKGETPLMRAIERDLLDVAELMIKKGCNLNSQDWECNPPYIHRGYRYSNVSKQTSIHHAVDRKDVKFLIPLVKGGANLNIQNSEGETPLLVSIRRGNIDSSVMLIENGADINLSNSDKTTPLMTAIHYDRIDVAILLIKKGCELDTQDNDKETALHLAVRNECITLLVRSGADINIRYKDGKTPLMKIIMNGRCGIAEYIVELFLQRGCNINVVDNENKTALHVALETKKYNVVQLLLQHGADPNIGKQILQENMSLQLRRYGRGYKQSVIHIIKRGYRSDLFPQHDSYPGLLCHILMKADSRFYQEHTSLLELLFLSGSCTQSRLFMLLKDPLYFSQFEKNPEILHWIESKSCSPMSLTNITRIAILAHIQPNKTKNIEETELPMTLRDFLQLNDIIDNDPVTEATRTFMEDYDDYDDPDDYDYYGSDDDAYDDNEVVSLPALYHHMLMQRLFPGFLF
ncbi:hypothetical protein LOTGIDRAFT_171317 [Lottia gigantea]|uniref:Uncharacterized protein n=1 Tax=Lottia gigantea TaxID=225164 RepID=V4B0F4_LOTGI|nr:hypothetical protein LOTGIDRAFT_171317 [Lottia gigantea]ESP03528.1 hypothetical protein LOTGIDRAFT_171317 [Lottia gigantea]